MVVKYYMCIFADEFRSRTACENDVMKLSCNPFSRVAVFDAQYGRTAYDVICPQRQGVSDESKPSLFFFRLACIVFSF